MWKKRGGCQNLEQYVTEQTGRSYLEITQPKDTNEYKIKDLHLIAERILSAVEAGKNICVIGDYDADGIDALAIMILLFRKIKAKYSLIIPRRFSEGYGMKPDMVKRIPEGSLVITIDNGITCLDAIKEAKAQGHEVLIMDHHLGGEELPDADIIVDPENDPQGSDFDGYCGAGLAFKLVSIMYPDDAELIVKASCFAAIAELADAVPVIEDARNIIMLGLKNLNDRKGTVGINTLMDMICKGDENGKGAIEFIDEETVKFSIAPVINATGRLIDNGGELTLAAIISENSEKAAQYATRILDNNKERKELCKKALEELSPEGEQIHFLYDSNLKEGLCGIIAGQLAEDGKPSFCMTDGENGIIKGSARCGAGNNVHDLLASISDILEGFGGHECAAGFSLKKENLEAMFFKLDILANPVENAGVDYYDLDMELDNVYNTFMEVQTLKPFGVGLELPVYRLKSRLLSSKVIGSTAEHMMFSFDGLRGIGFFLAEKYQELGSPEEVTAYGYLEANHFRGNVSPQFRIVDIE